MIARRNAAAGETGISHLPVSTGALAMRAMILAAGLGTRLLPLTHIRPKVLIPLRGVPVLDFWIERLARCRFTAVVLNAYHLKEALSETVSKNRYPMPVMVRDEPVLLGTGGGIRTAMRSFGAEPFVVVNGDIVCDAPVDQLHAQHVRSGAAVSLLLHDWPEFNNVAVDAQGSVLGFGEEAKRLRRSGKDVRLLAFTGIHFINPSALAGCDPGVPADILAVYRDLIARGTPPRALFCPGLFWREMGSIESYKKLSFELGSLPPSFLPPLRTGERVCLHPEARVAPGAELRGSVVAGRNVRISEGARLEDVILWDGARVGPGSDLRGCIVAGGVEVLGAHRDHVFVPDGHES